MPETHLSSSSADVFCALETRGAEPEAPSRCRRSRPDSTEVPKLRVLLSRASALAYERSRGARERSRNYSARSLPTWKGAS